ncbi:putative uncharacterized protein [Bacteroides thetaiotaomicron CAG:40]|nr:putative uncharacterized protein [Bacteroides thetaiotaomicron CAG:40]
MIVSCNLSGLFFLFFRIHTVLLAKQKSNIVMKVRFILSFLAALFIAGNMIAIESTDRVERKLPIVLRGEVPTTTSRSVPVIPIDASISTENNTVDIIFSTVLGEVKILVDGQVQEVCQVTAPGQTTSFSIEGWAPGVYKLEFKVAGGGYVYGELVIE